MEVDRKGKGGVDIVNMKRRRRMKDSKVKGKIVYATTTTTIGGGGGK